jgi:hypothetical protein
MASVLSFEQKPQMSPNVGRKLKADNAGLDARTFGRRMGWSKVPGNVALLYDVA